MDIVSTGIKRLHIYPINKVRFIFLRGSNREQIVGELMTKNKQINTQMEASSSK